MTPLLLTAVAALVFAALYVASPLTVWVMMAAAPLALLLSRGLPAGERRALLSLLAAGFAVRLVLIVAQVLAGIPAHNDGGVGALSGDEAYYLTRALRSRDLLLGLAATKYDYFVASDDYGRTSYLALLTTLQVMFGPTPYGMKVVNSLIFITGAALLFRMARNAFGAVPAFVGLAMLLFLPSLLVASMSLLKESLYSLVAAALTVAVLAAARDATEARWRRSASATGAALVCLWLLDDLRRGAVAIALAGIALAAVIRLCAGSRRRSLAAAAIAGAGLIVLLTVPSVQTATLSRVASVAKMHAGHVFTVGHAYKLLDEGFYKHPQTAISWDLVLSGPQALRFLVRAAISFVVVPWPWEMRSLSELAFMPELVLWYLMVAAFPIGFVAGWRLNPAATSLLTGMVLSTSAVLAVTTGNVGTLLRLRGLVIPTMVWLSAIGFCVIAQQVLAYRDRTTNAASPRLAEAGQP